MAAYPVGGVGLYLQGMFAAREDKMLKRLCTLVAVILAVVGLVTAKDKKKSSLPDIVLAAQTACVLIDPDAGIAMDDPGANKTAQDDVEKAMLNWGWLRLTMDEAHADLVIVLRKGNTKAVQPTVGGEPTNDRPVIVQGTDGATRIGVQQGHPTDAQPGQPPPTKPGMGGEIGPSDDSFLVYQGQVPAPLERAPLWRYMGKNGLKGPDVRAVAEFKKAVDEAVKQQQAQQKQQGQPQPTKP